MEKHSCKYCAQLVIVHKDGVLQDTDWGLHLGDVMEAERAGCLLFQRALLSMNEQAHEKPTTATDLRQLPMHTWQLFGVPNALVGGPIENQAEFTGSTTLALSMKSKTADSKTVYQGLGMYDVFADLDDPSAVVVRTRPPNRNQGSNETLALAKSWIDQCLASHQHEPIFEKRCKPSRLIQIRIEQDDYIIQLIETSRLQEDVIYVTLSYSWGGDQPHKLTKAMLEANTKLSFEDLPKTIQDAMVVTAQLGFFYIWVDSLCICQDNDEDKSKEIALMPFIYANSILTIAAASSTTAAEGFLKPRIFSTVYIPLHNLDNATKGSLGLVESSERPPHLDTRAWTLQEYLLSTRVLEFSTHQLAFSCRDHRNDGTRVDGWRPDSFLDKDRMSQRSLRENLPTEKHEAYELWLRIVEDYTSRDLTQTTDRILAIASAAHLLSTIIGPNEYAAGHWRSKMPLDLL